MALIEQGISGTLCSVDPYFIPWDILDQVGVFSQYLDQQVIENRGRIALHTVIDTVLE